jgi:hypothetical protein
MPIPKPKKEETKNKFLPRCMGDDTMVKEFKDVKQRYAVCLSNWTNKDKKTNRNDK